MDTKIVTNIAKTPIEAVVRVCAAKKRAKEAPDEYTQACDALIKEVAEQAKRQYPSLEKQELAKKIVEIGIALLEQYEAEHQVQLPDLLDEDEVDVNDVVLEEE